MTALRVEAFGASEVEAIVPAWDALAERLGRPFCSPHWLLPWGRHVATDARLRCIAAFDGDELAGVAPFFARREVGVPTFRMSSASGSGTPKEPLAVPGRERDVCAGIARCLSALADRPQLVAIDGMPTWRPWTEGLAAAWHRRAHHEFVRPLTWIDLRGAPFDEWLATKGAKTRKSMRRLRRRIEEDGASFRVATTADEAVAAVDAFVDLHRRQWAGRGGSAVLATGTSAMLADAAERLAPLSRLWIATIEVEGATVASEVFVSAGAVAADWLGGFDDAWSRFSPGLLVMMHGIEHAASIGVATVELGAGRQPFKHRLADGHGDVAWSLVTPSGPVRSPLASALTLARVGRRRAAALARRVRAGSPA